MLTGPRIPAMSAEIRKEVKGLLRRLVFLLPLVLAACAGGGTGAAPTINEADVRTVPYTGQWSGTLKTQRGFSQNPPQDGDIALAFRIDEKTFDVTLIRTDPGGAATETLVKPGTFAVRRFATNMVASSITTGMSYGSPWVETWVLTMTLIDADSMLVHWTRVVNNPLMPKDKADSKFSMIGMGVFVRSGPQH
jgi:hypothetical protein